MQYEVIIAGFGGQGVMFAGQLLANAAMMHDKNVIWMPSYGPEMRGGTANCTIVISDDPIGSPVIAHPSAVIAMNRPSMDKFEPSVKPGGLLIVDATLIDRKSERTDIRTLYIDSTRLANEVLQSPKTSNMIMLGAYIGQTQVTPLETIRKAMPQILKGKEKFLDSNIAALELGLAQSLHC